MKQDASFVPDRQDQELAPIIVKVGKKKKRQVRELKHGRGHLMEAVEQTLADVRSSLGEAAKDQALLPIVMLYEQKPRRRRRQRLGIFF